MKRKIQNTMAGPLIIIFSLAAFASYARAETGAVAMSAVLPPKTPKQLSQEQLATQKRLTYALQGSYYAVCGIMAMSVAMTQGFDGKHTSYSCGDDLFTDGIKNLIVKSKAAEVQIQERINSL